MADSSAAVTNKRKRILSGMQPTGTGALHLGNLEGALRTWVKLQDQYEMFCCIVDWHALTTMYDRAEDIKANVRVVAAEYIAAGLGPEECAVLVHNPREEHAELYPLAIMGDAFGRVGPVPAFQGMT